MELLHEFRVIGSDICLFGLISLKVIQLDWCIPVPPDSSPHKFVFASYNGLSIAGFMNDKISIALLTIAAQHGCDGNTVDTEW